MSDEKKLKPTYIMVPRKLIVAWIASSTVLFIMIVSSFQYTNYVDRKSNNLLCGIINLSYTSTKIKPPPSTKEEQNLADAAIVEFDKLRKGYHCI